MHMFGKILLLILFGDALKKQGKVQKMHLSKQQKMQVGY